MFSKHQDWQFAKHPTIFNLVENLQKNLAFYVSLGILKEKLGKKIIPSKFLSDLKLREVSKTKRSLNKQFSPKSYEVHVDIDISKNVLINLDIDNENILEAKSGDT